MFLAYLIMFIILIFFIVLILYNFKKYDHSEIIKKDLEEIKKPEVYQNIIKKNTEQVNIEGVIDIEELLESVTQLKLNLNDLKQEIDKNDFENKNNKLKNDTVKLQDENINLNIKLEEIKQEIKNIFNDTQANTKFIYSS